MSTMMQYNGYTARVTLDQEERVFHGEVIGLNDIVTFQGSSVDELVTAFQDSVEDYLEFCAEKGKEPDKPFNGKLCVRMDGELHRAAMLAAAERGESLNAFICEIVEEKAEHFVRNS